MNLLEETLKEITKYGHTPTDIKFIGSYSGEYRCSWEEFKQLADIWYDDGFGDQEIAADLIILFTDGTKHTRYEYDGSEYWLYDGSALIDYDWSGKPIRTLKYPPDDSRRGWANILSEMNKGLD